MLVLVYSSRSVSVILLVGLLILLLAESCVVVTAWIPQGHYTRPKISVTTKLNTNHHVAFSRAIYTKTMLAGNTRQQIDNSDDDKNANSESRRSFLTRTIASSIIGGAIGFGSSTLLVPPQSVEAIGPVKITLVPVSYTATVCPPNKPIPGQKAMVGMKGMCVTVVANLQDTSPKELEKVGVYGFITDGETGDSVLANNPDLSTDAGQFAMIEKITPSDKTISFEFIAAVPFEKDLSQYSNGIGPLNFDSLRIISYPGGQQFGAISPCEMNEFSSECEEWEAENGPYVKQDYMIKSNPRTKGY